MRCIYGHWVIGVWRKLYRLPGGGYVCDHHKQDFIARVLSEEVSLLAQMARELP